MEEGENKFAAPCPGNSGSVTLSLVIITKDTRELLKGLLHSIESDVSLRAFGTEVIIIDNASSDGTDEFIKGSFPQVKYLRNARNMGFAASVNAGSRLAQGRFIMLLNSDTILVEGDVAKMVAFAESTPAAAIIGPQLVYEDLGLQRSVAYIPALIDEIFPGLFRRSPAYAAGSAGTDHSRDVESLIGAAIMIRMDVLNELNGFDERFFFFLEETDFCLRARLKGYRVVFLPRAKVIHLQGATVKKTWVEGRMEYNISLRKFMKKHHGPAYALVFAWIRFLKALFFVIFMPAFLSSAKIRMRYSYYLSLLEWYLKGCPDNAGLNRRVKIGDR